MIRYVHGSEDSLDLDVFYVFESMPTFVECQKFCSDKEENRNIIVVKEGIVSQCFKGTIDEINNGLLHTYPLHEQQCENIVTKTVERDVLIKIVRVMRCLLSHCSRTQYRLDVKKVLKSSSWKDRLSMLDKIDFTSIDDYGKSGSKEDVLKVFAFQLGQVFGLIDDNNEYYTKSSIAKQYPLLHKYLYRQQDSDISDLANEIDIFYHLAASLNITEKDGIVTFVDYDKSFDLVKEQYAK
ncbi:MAG: hypothetical protein K0R18_73 [Bacillales bacterium]|jgi:hypothetical protein|nr:hypothetical protein [Bacillales bacterium]